jgi:phage terminase Nu1 subunit (DNA packaging protein)
LAKSKDDIVSTSDLGDWLGLSAQAIAGHAASKILKRASRGKFYLRASVRGYAEHMRKSASGRNTVASTEKARLTSAQADAAEHKLRVMRGEYVPAADVQAEWSDIMRAVRAAMLTVASRAGARLPHLTAADISEIDLEVRDVLTETSKEGNP